MPFSAVRPFTAVRDAKVLISTLEHLAEHFGDQANVPDVDGVRRALREHHQEVRQHMLEEDKSGLGHGGAADSTSACKAVARRPAWLVSAGGRTEAHLPEWP